MRRSLVLLRSKKPFFQSPANRSSMICSKLASVVVSE
jgi:hypothetical protein